jgi:hypothetical protein
MKIEIHTLQWHQDHSVREGDEDPATANILTVVDIDGVRYDNVVSTRVEQSSDFALTTISFLADTTVTSHTQEEWDAGYGPPEGIRAKTGKRIDVATGLLGATD